jgi:hypothetical protein
MAQSMEIRGLSAADQSESDLTCRNGKLGLPG